MPALFPLATATPQPTPLTADAAAVPTVVIWGAVLLLILVFAGVVWASRQ